jgi:hypothetical protein
MQRKAASDTAQILAILKTTNEQLQAIHHEVDKPLISELWFGFVSDRFTAALNRLLGFDSEPSTPLWAAGVLSLGLLILRILLVFLNKVKPESRAAKVMGKTFAVFVSLYLVVLTGSLFMLATHVPDSPVETYRRQVEASDKLTREMQSTSYRVNTLLEPLKNAATQIDALKKTIDQARSTQTGVTAHTHPEIVVAIEKIEKLLSTNLPVVAAMKNDVATMRGEIQQVRARQHGGFWTALVGLAALVSLVSFGLVLYYRKRW